MKITESKTQKLKEISKIEREIQFVKITVGTWNNGFEALTEREIQFAKFLQRKQK